MRGAGSRVPASFVIRSHVKPSILAVAPERSTPEVGQVMRRRKAVVELPGRLRRIGLGRSARAQAPLFYRSFNPSRSPSLGSCL
jgi:hypothetical protein